MVVLGKVGKIQFTPTFGSSSFSSTRESGSFCAIHLENVATVSETVQQRGRHPLPLEDLIPFAEREVRRDQKAPPLVAVDRGQELSHFRGQD